MFCGQPCGGVQGRPGAQQEVLCLDEHPEGLREQPPCLCVSLGHGQGSGMLSTSNCPGYSTWSLAPLSVADQHDPLFFMVV